MGNAEFCPLCGEITGGWQLPYQEHTCKAHCSKCGKQEPLPDGEMLPVGWAYNDGTRVWKNQTKLWCPDCRLDPRGYPLIRTHAQKFCSCGTLDRNRLPRVWGANEPT